MVEWIVAGFVAIGNALGSAVDSVFASFGLVGETARDGLVFSFGNVGDAFLGVAVALNSAILDVAATAGPAAPVVAFVLFVGVVFALLLALRGLARLYTVVRTWIV